MKKYAEYLQGKNKDYNRPLIDALEDDGNQCVRCSGIRAAGSPLCVACLVATINSLAPLQDILEARIKELEGKNKKLREICERLIDHVTSEAVHNSVLEEKIHRYWLKD